MGRDPNSGCLPLF